MPLVPPSPPASSGAVRKRMQRMSTKRDTRPELALRRELHRLGLRYRVDAAPLADQPRRRADVVFGAAKVAVFVDGCFWHGCPRHGNTPTSNSGYWTLKLQGNRQRDADTNAKLKAAGWRVVRVWEHEAPSAAAARVAKILWARAGGTAKLSDPTRKVGHARTTSRRSKAMADPRAFVSFDFDHNETERILFAGQAKKDSPTPFAVQDWSSKSSLPQATWEAEIKKKINSTNMCIVLVGTTMPSATGVAKEIAMAKSQDVPLFGVYVGGAGTSSTLPTGLSRARTVGWNWDEIAAMVDQCMTEGKNGS